MTNLDPQTSQKEEGDTEELHPLELKYGKEPPFTEEELNNPSWH